MVARIERVKNLAKYSVCENQKKYKSPMVDFSRILKNVENNGKALGNQPFLKHQNPYLFENGLISQPQKSLGSKNL